MIVKIWYESSRIDVFDTQISSPISPYGQHAILADYELRLDRMAEKGLRLEAHYYDADPAFRTGDSDTPTARRKRGWQMLLADKNELSHIRKVAVDGSTTLLRIGNDLVDMERFYDMEEVLLGGALRGISAQGISMHDTLANALQTPSEEALEALGLTEDAYQWLLAVGSESASDELVDEDWGDVDEGDC